LPDPVETNRPIDQNPEILYIGTPEADAAAFERLARANFPDITLFATNDPTRVPDSSGGRDGADPPGVSGSVNSG